MNSSSQGYYSHPNKIRVLFARNPPDAFDNCGRFPTLLPSMACPFPGWSVEIFVQLMQALNIEIIPYVYETALGTIDWGSLQPNGSWSGALAFLQNDTVDAICLQFQRTANRQQYFDFTYPITFVQEMVVVQEVDGSYTLTLGDVFQPFTSEAWMFFGFSLIVCLLIFLFIRQVEWKISNGREEDFSIWQTTWCILAFQLYQQSPSFQMVTDSAKILYTVFGVVHILLLMGLYQGFLITALLHPSDPYPFRTLSQMSTMIGSGEYQLLESQAGNWIYDEIRTTTTFEGLRKALDQNPALIVPNDGDLVPTAKTGKYVFFSQIDAYTTYLLQNYCGFLTITDDLPQKTSHFLFQKNSPFLEAVNKQVIQQQSFIMRTYTKYFESGFQTNSKHVVCPASTIDDITPLALRNCAGIFWLLLIGLGVSILGFLAEIFCFRFAKKISETRKCFR